MTTFTGTSVQAAGIVGTATRVIQSGEIEVSGNVTQTSGTIGVAGTLETVAGSTTTSQNEPVVVVGLIESGQTANNLWVFDQKALPGLVEEIRGFDSLELTFEASANEIEKYRRLAKDDGKYGLVVRSDGGFDSVGTANGNNTFTAAAPLQRKELRTVDRYVVEDFTESRIGSQSNVYEIEVTLVPEKEKSWDNEYGTLTSRINDTRQSGEWLFEFERGDIATNQVTTEIERSSGRSTDRLSITLITRLDGSRIIEESVSRLNAIDSFDVQDGQGGIEDVSDSNRNTVQITSPNDVEFDDGQWIVVDWETEWQNRAFVNTLSLEQ